MIAAIAIFVTIVVVLALVVPWFLKAEVDTAHKAEERVRDRRTPTITYRVPNGVDVAVVAGAVAAAGHAQAIGSVDGDECLLVKCHPGEREEIRTVIDRATREHYGAGSGLRLGTVTFTDEAA